MPNTHQMPLFASQPMLPEDIDRRTTLGETISLFQGYLQKEGKSVHTIKSFTFDMALLLEWAGEDKPVGKITTSMLNDFLHWMEIGRGVPCSRKTYARRVTTLKVYFKWLHSLGALLDDPAKAILQRSGAAPLSNILNDDQIADCLNYAAGVMKGDQPDARPELLFRLLLDSGIKKGEAVALTLTALDRANPEAPFITVKHKSARDKYKERRIMLDKAWLRVLDQYRLQYPITDAIFTCSARNLEYILEDVGNGGQVPFKVSFEIMRWTSAVRDFRAGVDPDAIRDKLGLSDASWIETLNKIKQLSAQLDGKVG